MSPTDATVENFGWPCYEGPRRQPGFDAADLNLCETLYAQGAVTGITPYFSYAHFTGVYAGDPRRRQTLDVDVSGRSELRLIVTDGGNGIDSDHADWADARIDCGTTSNTAPTATIATPVSGTTWKVGDVIAFSGRRRMLKMGHFPLPRSRGR